MFNLIQLRLAYMAMATKWFTGYKDELSNYKPNRVIFMLKFKSFMLRWYKWTQIDNAHRHW